LTDSYESEGFDRDHMRMPAGHNRLIEAVAKANPNTAVVLMSGSAVEIPWDARVKSILYMGLPGQAGGEAIVDLLTGRAVPCGKLAESWPVRYEDCVSSSYYGQSEFDSRQSQPDSRQSEPDSRQSKPDSRQGKTKCSQEQNDLRVQVPYRDAHYREGIYVGYRYYASSGTKVRYPFGHGLSYTEFAYSDLVVQGDQVTFCVTNIGPFPGKEIAQVYVSPPDGAEAATRLYRPRIELKAFGKVALEPRERKKVTLQLDARSYAIWHNGWQIPAGRYMVRVGSCSENLPLGCMVEKAAMSLPDSGSLSGAAEIQAMPTNLKQKTAAAEAVPAGFEALPAWYPHPQGHPSHKDWERMLGRSVSSQPLRKGQFAMDDSVMEMKDHSLVMRIFYKAILHSIKRRLGGKMDESDPHFRMVISSAADASLSCMKINGGMNNHLLEGLLEMANGRYLRGIRVMLTGKN
jgi:beta-glucosidase